MIRALFTSGLAQRLGSSAALPSMAPETETMHGWSDGILAGTLIATATGWTPAERLQPADSLVTFDNGLRRLRAVSIARLVTPEPAARSRALLPLAVPPGVLGNRRTLTLLPGQPVLIESDAIEARFGEPFAVMPASALEGHMGIQSVEAQPEHQVVLLEFESDEIVYAEGMTLLQCPRRNLAMVTSAEELITAGDVQQYPLLPAQLGRAMLPGAAV